MGLGLRLGLRLGLGSGLGARVVARTLSAASAVLCAGVGGDAKQGSGSGRASRTKLAGISSQGGRAGWVGAGRAGWLGAGWVGAGRAGWLGAGVHVVSRMGCSRGRRRSRAVAAGGAGQWQQRRAERSTCAPHIGGREQVGFEATSVRRARLTTVDASRLVWGQRAFEARWSLTSVEARRLGWCQRAFEVRGSLSPHLGEVPRGRAGLVCAGLLRRKYHSILVRGSHRWRRGG